MPDSFLIKSLEFATGKETFLGEQRCVQNTATIQFVPPASAMEGVYCNRAEEEKFCSL